jgi:C4-dicarboxylate-specific signal transduction histidine kinase
MDQKEIIILILLTIILVLLVWILVIRNKYKRDYDKLHSRLKEDKDQEIENRTQALLRLVTIPIQWALRTEMMSGSLAQVEQYLFQIVKEPGIDYAALVDLNGEIKLASDKKTEGKAYKDVFKEDISGMDKMQIVNREHDEKIILAPITGLNEKLGTVILRYHPRSA